MIWAATIFIGGFLATDGKRLFRYFFYGAAGYSLVVTWLLCRHPFTLYQETTFGTTERAGDLFVLISNLHVYLPNLLPSFIKIEQRGWAPNGYWIAALAALTAAFPSGEKWTFYSLSRVARMGDPASFAILQDDRDYDFYFATRKPLDKLEVEFGSPHGDYAIRLLTADAPAFSVTTHREVMIRTIESPPAYRRKGLSLYRVSIRLDKKSDVRTAVTPYVFALRSAR